MTYQRYQDNPNGLWRFFVRRSGMSPVSIDDALDYRISDFPEPGITGPAGQETCDCVLSADGYSAIECCTFAPFNPPISSNAGNGGDVQIVTNDGYAKIAATTDGGRPGVLVYFVGPGIGMAANGSVGGWVTCGPDLAVGSWKSVVTNLTESLNSPSAPISGLVQSYTRYLIGEILVPFLTFGGAPVTRELQVLISEHYSGADPKTSDAMERFFYADGYGRIRWESWSTTALPATSLNAAAPAMPWGYPDYPPLNTSQHIVYVRHWANILPLSKIYIPSVHYFIGQRRSIADFGWPSGFVLP